ncbi:MAG: hypothetical protein Q7S08_01335 [bacterium]|nr:hypothetical protein [bacterium]
MSLNKPGRLGNVTRLLGVRKLKNTKTGEAIKVHKVHIPRDYIKIGVEGHHAAKLIFQKYRTQDTGQDVMRAILLIKQATGYEPEYGSPAPMGKDMAVNLFGQTLLIRPLAIEDSAEGSILTAQINHVSGDAKISFNVLPVVQ